MSELIEATFFVIIILSIVMLYILYMIIVEDTTLLKLEVTTIERIPLNS